MAYFAQNSRAEGMGFEYPPVLDAHTYPDPHTTFDAINAYSGYHAPVPKARSPLPPSHDYSLEYQAMVSSKETPPSQASYPDHGFRIPDLRGNAIASSPTSSLDYGLNTPSVSMNATVPPAPVTKASFVHYPGKAGSHKKLRGTTGRHICDSCDVRFTVVSSLHRHKKICRGLKSAKKSESTQNRIIKPKNATEASDHSDRTLHAIRPRFVPSGEKNHVVGLGLDMPTTPAATMVVERPRAEDSGLISDPNTSKHHTKKPRSTQSYVPRGPDTSADHEYYFCDLCPETCARRDILQLHKATVHGLTESFYLPESGTIDRPPYLEGKNHENASTHSRRALKTWEGGGLSTSPCQPCILRGLDCIVNPFSSPKCCFCNCRDQGWVCGAAGVRYL